MFPTPLPLGVPPMISSRRSGTLLEYCIGTFDDAINKIVTYHNEAERKLVLKVTGGHSGSGRLIRTGWNVFYLLDAVHGRFCSSSWRKASIGRKGHDVLH